MMKTYTVGVREVHVRHFQVNAENEAQAKELVQQSHPSVEDLEHFEYSHELDPDTWSAEENNQEQPQKGEEDHG